MTATLHLVVTLVLCTALVRPLARARWTWRSPRTAILLWQMLAATWVLCAVGAALAIGLSPYGRDIPTALAHWLDRAALPVTHAVVLSAGLGLALALVVAFVWSWLGVLRVRRRHRRMLSLVAREDAALPGVLVLDHPVAVAYCVPGLRSRIVLSAGALRTFGPEELAAVVAHERSHARERHDLVVLPFVALRRLLPRAGLAAVAADAVRLLVEMRADERACRSHGAGSLSAALRRFGGGAVPRGSLGIMADAVEARLARLDRAARPLPLLLRWSLLLAGGVLVSTPLSFLVI